MSPTYSTKQNQSPICIIVKQTAIQNCVLQINYNLKRFILKITMDWKIWIKFLTVNVTRASIVRCRRQCPCKLNICPDLVWRTMQSDIFFFLKRPMTATAIPHCFLFDIWLLLEKIPSSVMEKALDWKCPTLKRHDEAIAASQIKG